MPPSEGPPKEGKKTTDFVIVHVKFKVHSWVFSLDINMYIYDHIRVYIYFYKYMCFLTMDIVFWVWCDASVKRSINLEFNDTATSIGFCLAEWCFADERLWRFALQQNQAKPGSGQEYNDRTADSLAFKCGLVRGSRTKSLNNDIVLPGSKHHARCPYTNHSGCRWIFAASAMGAAALSTGLAV